MKKRPHAQRASRTRRPHVPRLLRARRLHEPQLPAAQTLELPVECTLAAAEDLRLRLAALVHSEQPITVDVSRVRRIDTASMQLLAVFARDRRSGERAVKIGGESSAFAEATRLLGLERLLGTSLRETSP